MPGGGAALLACRSALEGCAASHADSDKRAAYRILLQALEEPLRVICHNGGYDSAKIAELTGMPSGYGIDIRSGAVREMVDAGIIDVASVQIAAVRSAVSGAALALTIDVLLHHKDPQPSYTP